MFGAPAGIDTDAKSSHAWLAENVESDDPHLRDSVSFFRFYLKHRLFTFFFISLLWTATRQQAVRVTPMHNLPFQLNRLFLRNKNEDND